LLKASHIKPWRDSDNAERLDIYNGLLLIPNLDSAFDKGYISFDDGGKIIISDMIKDGG
jgi:5-methylcytosine-specific restriction protein A